MPSLFDRANIFIAFYCTLAFGTRNSSYRPILSIFTIQLMISVIASMFVCVNHTSLKNANLMKA